jgi:hypothetical protein
MNKIIMLLLGLTTFLSCTYNDDSSTDQIIGEWKLIRTTCCFFEGGKTTDYANENIIYNFRPNGMLLVTGGQNVEYPNGEYNYFFGKDYLGGGTSEPKTLLVKINSNKWTYNFSEGIMTLGMSYVDGPDLHFERK